MFNSNDWIEVFFNWLMIFCVSFIVIMFLLFFSTPFWKYDTTRNGEHSGFVTAIEQQGVIFSNYRVYFKTDNSSSQEDVYCVNRANKELADILKQKNLAREQVTIQYEGVRAWGMGLCDVEILGVR